MASKDVTDDIVDNLIIASFFIIVLAVLAFLYDLAKFCFGPSLTKKGPNQKIPMEVVYTVMHRKKRLMFYYPLLLVFILSTVFIIVPPLLEGIVNGITEDNIPKPSAEALVLHENLNVVDMHSDSLMWSYRDLLTKYPSGHVDIPRMIEGNMFLQMFTIVTKAPFNMNFESNKNDSDVFTLAAVAQRWPIVTYSSLLERALFQAKRLHELSKASDGQLSVISTKKQLKMYTKRRKDMISQGVIPQFTAGMLGVEGSHCAEGKVENIDKLFNAGIRMIGLTHFFDNEAGGSAHGEYKHGITETGIKFVRRMEQLGILVDISHASENLVKDVLKIAKRPVVSSHTGVRGTCDNVRNLSDEQLRGVAATGGIISIGFFKQAICHGLVGIINAIKHAIDVVGVEHVALGSDFDGSVSTPFTISDMAVVTDGLLKAGLSEEDIGLVMGGNALRLLEKTLPDNDIV